MKTALFLFVALTAFLPLRIGADSVSIVGDVFHEKHEPALGQTVNVVSTPEDVEGKDSKGNGITQSPAGNYVAPVPNVGDRVTGLWVTCLNDNEVAQPNYVPFTSKTARTYNAKRLILLPKQRSNFSKAEATTTIEALALTYELHVWGDIIKLRDAANRMSKECWTILQVINREPADQNTINELMWTVHDNIIRRVKGARVLDESWKLETRIAPKARPK